MQCGKLQRGLQRRFQFAGGGWSMLNLMKAVHLFVAGVCAVADRAFAQLPYSTSMQPTPLAHSRIGGALAKP
jgi:hypothetical protein